MVVSPPALLAAQAHINRNIIPEHRLFLEHVHEFELEGRDQPVHAIQDLPKLLHDVFNWEPGDILGAPGAKPIPSDLEINLPEYGETLRPTFAVNEFEPKEGQNPWLMLIQEVKPGLDLDEIAAGEDERHWQASPHARFEPLLRESKVPIGVLSNQTHLRLVYAPRGETSGHLTFRVKDMSEVAGRSIFAALHMLLCAERLFSLEEKRRLPAILSESRKFQNLVSTQLAQQVLAALYELVRGFQAANDQRRGELLKDVLKEDPDHVYAGLLTVLMRLVFVLYAEDRGLLSRDPVYLNHYSVSGLFERLRSDASRYPDTMDQRFGAWAQLLALFRMVYDGARHGASFQLPPRHGHLFDPHRYNFLEGRPWKEPRKPGGRIQPPMVSDGVIYRVLENLLVLDGERLSYRTLDVEQIGSVYETMMGFRMETAQGRSIAIRPVKAHGAPTVINLDALLKVEGDKRAKWLDEATGQSVTGEALTAFKAARKTEDLVAALEKKLAREATPNIVPPGAMVLQPSDERRRSGSHYTPRLLTEPIVRKTLEPILKRLGEKRTPEQILDLKVCDPAMGSGAFLVEACRQLGDVLVKAWHVHNKVPKVPPDEDEILLARRLLAQRCLYGVDKNPMAVDLAKLSLWLATLAKDHPFTFLDHALRHGDSLVGLTQQQIASFSGPGLEAGEQVFSQNEFKETIQRVSKYRREILELAEDNPYSVSLKQQKLKVADGVLEGVRQAGHLVCAAFFGADKATGRQKLLIDYRDRLMESRRGTPQALLPLLKTIDALCGGQFPVTPFHWEIEFPEVFDRENGGFDAIVGNPPYGGKNTVIEGNRDGYLDWLKTLHAESHGNADLVAHFFRRAFTVLRRDGTFGLIATNTIRQGDTRQSGLRWICVRGGGTIYAARRRYKWAGAAAVVVSVVWVVKGTLPAPFDLDGKTVSIITAYLFHDGGHENPATLAANAGRSFIGSYVLGMGFTFDDTDKKGVANPLAEMERLIAKDPRNAAHLPVSRRRGSERQPHARAPPLRHQFRRLPAAPRAARRQDVAGRG